VADINDPAVVAERIKELELAVSRLECVVYFVVQGIVETISPEKRAHLVSGLRRFAKEIEDETGVANGN
jgi:hypothetical protein